MLITNEKRVFYVEDILELVSEDELEFESKCVASEDPNSVVHKLLHASSCIVLEVATACAPPDALSACCHASRAK